MTTTSDTRAMLARRPHASGVSAFGHVDVSPAGRAQLHGIVEHVSKAVLAKNEVAFHPDDVASDNEVLVAPLKGFDAWFQQQAAWSLERTVKEIRATGSPQTLSSAGITDGAWSFYAVRTNVGGRDSVVVRAKSPSWGLTGHSKLLTRFVGGELKLVDEPLIAFDRTADLIVIGAKVYVLNPRQVETLLIDADAVKGRAPQTAASFDQKVKAALSVATVTAVQKVCSQNANVARRVERLIRDGDLANVTATKIRAALPNAGLKPAHFGASGPLRATTDLDATVLIDLAADLYYQPRFSAAPRRVAAYRRVR